MIPFFPIIFGIGAALSVLGLSWYDSLSPADKKLADQRAADLALELYGKAINQLTRAQLNAVAKEVRTYLGV